MIIIILQSSWVKVIRSTLFITHAGTHISSIQVQFKHYVCNVRNSTQHQDTGTDYICNVRNSAQHQDTGTIKQCNCINMFYSIRHSVV